MLYPPESLTASGAGSAGNLFYVCIFLQFLIAYGEYIIFNHRYTILYALCAL